MALFIQRNANTIELSGMLRPEQLPEVKAHIITCFRTYGCVHLDLQQLRYDGYCDPGILRAWFARLQEFRQPEIGTRQPVNF